MAKYKSDFLNSSIVNEPLAAYSKRTRFWDNPIYNKTEEDYIQGLNFEELLQSKLILLQLIKTGISTTLFKAIVKQSPFDMTEWTEFLDIPLRTIQRYIKNDKLLKPIHSEKIIEFTQLIKQGIETFNSVEKFKGWLCTPSYIFSGQSPCDLLSNTIGIQMVSDELINIEHGLFA